MINLPCLLQEPMIWANQHHTNDCKSIKHTTQSRIKTHQGIELSINHKQKVVSINTRKSKEIKSFVLMLSRRNFTTDDARPRTGYQRFPRSIKIILMQIIEYHFSRTSNVHVPKIIIIYARDKTPIGETSKRVITINKIQLQVH